jgi:hypothetical protein
MSTFKQQPFLRMKLLRLLIPCLFIYSFFSCKKSETLSVIAGSSYHKSGINSGPIRVFSSDGEITDPGIKNRFERDDKFYFEDITNPYNTAATDLLDSIVFADPLHAVVSADFQSYNCNVAYKYPLIVLSRADTSAGTTNGETLTHQITYYIGKIKPQLFFCSYRY